MKDILINIILFLIFLSSCNNVVTENRKIKIDLKKEGRIEDFFQDDNFISLETNSENLIRAIDKIQIQDDKLIILDKMLSQVYIYDSKGYYISKLDKKGMGPEEYIDIADFAFDKQLLYILSRTDRKINVYSLSFDYIKTYKLDDFYDYLHLKDDYIYLHSNFSNSTSNNITILNKNSSEIENQLSPFSTNQSFSFSPSPFNFTSDNGLLICHPFDYTIYSLNHERIYPILSLEFDTEEKIPKDYEKVGFYETYQDLSKKPVIMKFDKVYQNNSNYYALYNYMHERYLTRVDAVAMKSETIKLILNEKYSFIFGNPLLLKDNLYICCLPAHAVLAFQNDFFSDKNKDGILKEDDNPVIFIYELKN